MMELVKLHYLNGNNTLKLCEYIPTTFIVVIMAAQANDFSVILVLSVNKS